MGYQQEVIIHTNASSTFKALSQQVANWWGKVDRGVTQLGDEFTITFGATFWKFQVSRFVENQSLYWKCIDANHIHEGLTEIEKEWVGTEVQWVIEESSTGIHLTMKHEGLNKELNCYKVCEPAWDHFVLGSLKNYLENDVGNPHIE